MEYGSEVCPASTCITTNLESVFSMLRMTTQMLILVLSLIWRVSASAEPRLSEQSSSEIQTLALSGKITFTEWSRKDSDSDFNVYIDVMNADGSSRTQLTDYVSTNGNPVWSPDGSKIAYESGDHGIVTLDANGSNRIEITVNIPGASAPAWSPDGSKIAFHSFVGNFPDIFVINADGSDLRNLTNRSEAYDRFPTWSPDGRKIAFLSKSDLNQPDRIFLMKSDGSNIKKLTSGQDVANPAWSPQGDKLAFWTVSDGMIWTMNADGSNQTPITERGNGGKPSWSPDGSKIIFSSLTETHTVWRYDLFVVDVDGNNLVNITNTPDIDEIGPSWTIDIIQLLQQGTASLPDPIIPKTLVGGAYENDVVWGLSGSPYLLYSDVYISNRTLTISPGVIVRMNGKKIHLREKWTSHRPRIQVNGVIFKSNEPGSIVFGNHSGGSIRNSVLERVSIEIEDYADAEKEFTANRIEDVESAFTFTGSPIIRDNLIVKVDYPFTFDAQYGNDPIIEGNDISSRFGTVRIKVTALNIGSHDIYRGLVHLKPIDSLSYSLETDLGIGHESALKISPGVLLLMNGKNIRLGGSESNLIEADGVTFIGEGKSTIHFGAGSFGFIRNGTLDGISMNIGGTSPELMNNRLVNSDISVDGGGTPTIKFNDFYDNSSLVVRNASVIAKENWWGDPKGPQHPNNPSGKGIAVSDNIDFTLWSTRPNSSIPYLTELKPGRNALDIASNTDIYLEIKDNSGIDRNSIELSTNGASVSPTITEIQNGYALLYDPPLDFDFDQTVSVLVNATDISGKLLSETYSFRIRQENASLDKSVPFITNLQPLEDATRVTRNTNIYLEVNGKNRVEQASLKMKVNGEETEPVISPIGNGYVLSYDPPQDFRFDQIVAVEVNADDVNGNAMSETYSFTIIDAALSEDRSSPFISNVHPPDQTKDHNTSTSISLEVKDNSGIDKNSLKMEISDKVVEPLMIPVENGYALHYDPPTDFDPEQTVTVRIIANDLNGNTLDKAYSFTTARKNTSILQFSGPITTNPALPTAFEKTTLSFNLKNTGTETWDSRSLIAEINVLDIKNKGPSDSFWLSQSSESVQIRQSEYHSLTLDDSLALNDLAPGEFQIINIPFVFSTSDYADKLQIIVHPDTAGNKIDDIGSEIRISKTDFQMNNPGTHLNCLGELLTGLTHGIIDETHACYATTALNVYRNRTTTVSDTSNVFDLLKQGESNAEKFVEAGQQFIDKLFDSASEIEEELTKNPDASCESASRLGQTSTFYSFTQSAWNEFNGKGCDPNLAHSSIATENMLKGMLEELASKTGITNAILVGSPVDLEVTTDQGDTLGITMEGGVKGGIQDALGFMADKIKVILVPTQNTYTVKIAGQDTGFTGITIVQPIKEGEVVVASYNQVPVNSDFVALLNLTPITRPRSHYLNVDTDGNGTIDYQKGPTHFKKPEPEQSGFVFFLSPTTQYVLRINSKYGQTQGGGSYDLGETVNWSVTSPVIVDGVAYIADLTSGSVVIDSPKTIDIIWKKKFALTLDPEPRRGNPRGFGWHDPGSTVDWSVTSPTDNDTLLYIAETSSGTVVMDTSKKIQINWKEHYALKINSDRGHPKGDGWYSPGFNAQWSITSPVEVDGRTYYARPSSGAIEMNGPRTINVLWAEQKNTPPGIHSIGSISVYENEPILFELALTDDRDNPGQLPLIITQYDSSLIAEIRTVGSSITILPGQQTPVTTDITLKTVDSEGAESEEEKISLSWLSFPNNPPAASSDSVETLENNAVSIPVLTNDSDTDGDQLTTVSVTQGAHGAVRIHPNASALTYTPDLTYAGTDHFLYRITDGKGHYATAGVLISVRLRGDFDKDNTVGFSDFTFFLDRFETSDSLLDLNHDGSVDMTDFAVLVSKFGDTVGSRTTFVQTIPKTGAIFPDLNIEITVREALSKPEGEIQPAEFETLQTLRAPDRGIIRLDGVEKLIALNKLALQRNQISDISALLNSPGINSGDEINLKENPLSQQAISTHIPALEAKGVKVEH